MITQDHLDRSMSYPEYSKLLNDLMAQGRTTGGNQSDAYLNYAKLNLQRMHRLEKTAELTEEIKDALSKISSPYTWLVLTEGWCGDAAQNVPVLHVMELACANISLRLLLRDENLDVMDQYLTNGGRSIPKVICLKKEDNGTLREVFVWGPRPEAAQKIVTEDKQKGVPHEQSVLTMQKWYNADKTLSLQREFLFLLSRM